MVMGAILRNCIVKNCSAALRGGGIYMDGGGTVDHCLIDQCQTLGVGIIDGLGGGVAAEYKGRVRHSMITRCVARDRKSTRLNSSHANISYAVFCLKKKTQKQ